MAAPSVGATPAAKQRDQAAAGIRKHEEPPQGGSFILVHLRMSAYDAVDGSSTGTRVP